jgi:uncharacterized membrane protein
VEIQDNVTIIHERERILTMQGEIAAAPTPMPLHRKRVIFKNALHPYKPRNVNLVHEAEKAAGSFNQKVAVGLTNLFQAMPTFWLIMGWIVLWIIANATIVRFDPLPWPLLLTLASVPQLPLMIVIMVGQGLLGRKQELQSEEQYNTTMKTYHDIEQIAAHLSAQDDELLRQSHMIIHLLMASGITAEQLEDIQTQALAQRNAENSDNTATG